VTEVGRPELGAAPVLLMLSRLALDWPAMDGEHVPIGWASEPITEGEWAGWRSFRSADPFEVLTGPYYFRVEADGSVCCGFRAEHKHLNGAGFLHGGCMMTFADFALFAIAHERIPGLLGVTATLNGEFIGAVGPGSVLEARGEVVKAGRSLVFLRGMIRAAGEPVMTFSGVIKRMRPAPIPQP
jgi:uncharacterized protein (TIGR00369 family)